MARRLQFPPGMIQPGPGESARHLRSSVALELDPVYERYRRVLVDAMGVPFTAGNRVDILENGDQIFPAMLDAIRRARVSVEFLTFCYWTGEIAVEFAEALAERAAAGVRVRVLLDYFGARPMDRGLTETMERAGVEVVWFRPPTWRVWRFKHRTHRKILVCDGQVAFTGGVGIAQEWCGDARDPSEWRDTHFRVRGPSVPGLRAAFWGNWCETERPLDLNDSAETQADPCGDLHVQVLRSTSSVGWSDIATLHRALLRLAERRVRIATGYFVPDEHILGLLCEAERRGVELELLTPGPYTDQRLAQEAGERDLLPLLDAGVDVFQFQPTMIHCKLITVDGVLSVIGSANFNQRSMRHDDEVALVVLDRDFTAALDRSYDRDLRRSRQVRREDWARRGPLKRLREWIAAGVRDEL